MHIISKLLSVILILMMSCTHKNKDTHDKKIEKSINDKYNIELKPSYNENGFIEFIMLDGYKINEIPFEITDLDSLNHLRIDGVKLSLLPEWVTEIDQLRYLYLIDVPLVEFPSNLQKANIIENFCLSGSNITELPSEFNFPKLKILRLTNSPFINLPLINRNSDQEALTLYLKKTNITEIPKEYSKYQIRRFSIEDNRKLDHMDNLFGTYDSLKEVNIGYRGHTKFPMESFKKCYNLEVLSLTDQGLW
ncbi:hypothetical protein, partial [Flammeovirga sp. SJP92]|uniref:hypothetical protein n=1 Tax=Flammeovirga sp. SJP92 TaxID=1775430 RepID=UPI0012FC7F76